MLLLSNSLAEDSYPCSDILVETLLRIPPAAVSPSSVTALKRNYGRVKTFSAAQSQSFLDLESSLRGAEKDFSSWEMDISPEPEKAR